MNVVDWGRLAAIEYGRWYDRERLAAMVAALKQWGEEADVWCGAWSLPARVFYTLKAVVCLLMRWDGATCWRDVDNVATWNVSPGMGEYGGLRWETLTVGRGVFRGWRVSITEDGSV